MNEYMFGWIDRMNLGNEGMNRVSPKALRGPGSPGVAGGLVILGWQGCRTDHCLQQQEVNISGSE